MLNRTRLTPIVVLLFVSVAFAVQLPTDWVTYNSPEGRFSVGLPKTPTTSVKEIDSAVGKLHLYSFASSSSTSYYLASYGDYPNEPASEQRKVVIEAVRDGVLKNLEVQASSDAVISMDGYPGREFVARKTIDGVESIFTWRIYLVGRRLYQFAAVSNSPQPEIQKYFNSIRLMQ